MAQILKEGEHYYIEASTGLLVFTEKYHRLRGYCCKSGCRHCPYGNNTATDTKTQEKYSDDQPGK